MNASECITPFHLGRQALVYIRQSSPHQTLTNQESLKLQYALRQRAQEYGWMPTAIEVIDTDLGRTGSTTEGRHGFKDLVARVSLDQVGIIFAYDVTRLARNCTDWYQLLDLCGYRHCLVGDQDGVYDPATTNGRLILGLKGLISELELHTIRARLTAGILSKAQRGELALPLPVGLVRDPVDRVLKHPDQEVQGRVDLVFGTFLRLGSVAQVVRRFNDEKLFIPRKDGFGDICWRSPTVAAVSSLLQNPAYAGAFVYGRTRAGAKPGSTRRLTRQRLPMDQWKVCIRDKYPAYIDWATYERILTMLRDNRSDYRKQTRGIPRAGKALLHGIVYCGECGHKMGVSYRRSARYLCNFLRQQHHGPVCQYLPAEAIDDYVVELFLAALAPAELDVYTKALTTFGQEEEQVQRARQQQIERLRYQARLAERQFNLGSCKVDSIPDIEEGLNAGVWSVGVTRSSSMIGRTEEELAALSEPQRQAKLDDARRQFLAASAHVVIDSLADLPSLIDQFPRANAWNSAGVRPGVLEVFDSLSRTLRDHVSQHSNPNYPGTRSLVHSPPSVARLPR